MVHENDKNLTEKSVIALCLKQNFKGKIRRAIGSLIFQGSMLQGQIVWKFVLNN